MELSGKILRNMGKRIKISNQEIGYQVSYRDVEYPRLEFKTGSLVLILPRDSKSEEEIIKKHKDWIYKKNNLIQSALQDLKNEKLNTKRTDKELGNFVNQQASDFSRKLKVDINKVFLRRMKSKWGSLSSRKNLTINTFVKYLPNWLIKYVVFHEMVHLIERKHNERFWKIIGAKYENYQRYETYLLKYWFLIQKEINC
ncbi:MAG: metal-dependent hydrolase [bacterium (Candidatus Ratteibacteria) CG_4_10_14_3_um_filter_41_18]|uniref:Metal-dependent hydrolase n=3 Tax=Candidatus Ratteibacteria TaxID=2979319 RepID=A0A2M7YEX1_9BACT|nr:MAG: metal-dependent hydrolase [bacterium (Candidatus Ratteibacteria) CG15_BIG_FIL_POST_REV_8_21_14_020_41_12]PIX76678.1 MAG: metal-dependent hydrolase [bacterium (Candidatus Ratteibacteria) CG_4_10_14_3_um_filter_41_18]PJA61508.1 MAG: metal-dependent hydrolase [bacterium (Candidatus Ratteibacteria) CG_4_9_14_3_um_filter_41_21]